MSKKFNERNNDINLGMIERKEYLDKLIARKWRTEDGILIIGIQEFLLNKNSLDL